MKKKLFTLALAVILMAVAAGGTLAYFTAEDTAHNVITTSGVDIQLQEWQETAGGRVPYPNGPEDKPIQVMPGTKVSKIVEVKNLEAESWIRAQIIVTVLDSDGKPMELTQDELKKIVTIAISDKWEEKDGWYYYKTAVKTNETTAPLFEEVVYDGPNMGNAYQNCTFLIDVEAEAVQTANNGTSALTAAGWSE